MDNVNTQSDYSQSLNREHNNQYFSFYRQIIDSLEDYAVFTTDLKGNINSWNSGAEKIFGYSPKEIIGKNSAILFIKKDKDKREPDKELINAIKKGKVQDEKWHVRKDGAEFWASGLVFPLRDEQGKLMGFTKIARDLTERKIKEESEEKYRTLFNSIDEGFCVIKVIFDKNDNPRDVIFTEINPAFEKHTGMKNVTGKSLRQLYPSQEITELKIYGDVALKGESRRLEIYSPLLKRWFSIYATRPNEANHDKVIVVLNDITRRKALENQKDDFIGIVSHELKTPVTSVKAYTQVLRHRFEKVNDIKSAELMSKMNSQLDKLTTLIGDLLDATKIDSGRLQFHEEYFDFNKMVSDTVEQTQLTTEKHKIIKKLAETKTIYGDRERVSQVIINLLTNAIKYSPHETKIIVTTELDKSNIIVGIKDFGVGIDKELQGKIFERFYRVGEPGHETFPGLGLGLYIAKEIIVRQGGKMWVKSKKGVGSTFYFSLPLKRQKSEKQKNTLATEEMKHE